MCSYEVICSNVIECNLVVNHFQWIAIIRQLNPSPISINHVHLPPKHTTGKKTMKHSKTIKHLIYYSHALVNTKLGNVYLKMKNNLYTFQLGLIHTSQYAISKIIDHWYTKCTNPHPYTTQTIPEHATVPTTFVSTKNIYWVETPVGIQKST